MNTLEALKAKLNGKDVEGRWPSHSDPNAWWTATLRDVCNIYAINNAYIEWRLKPEIVTVDRYCECHPHGSFTTVICVNGPNNNVASNVRFSYEKDTGKLVNVEMIK